jgi:hypothetical protein
MAGSNSVSVFVFDAFPNQFADIERIDCVGDPHEADFVWRSPCHKQR